MNVRLKMTDPERETPGVREWLDKCEEALGLGSITPEMLAAGELAVRQGRGITLEALRSELRFAAAPEDLQ